jgi:DNA-binding response OmpR family regulator
MKILIVDDDPDQRELLRGFLNHQGYETLTAGGGAKALELLKQETVHLVLLDHRMPGYDRRRGPGEDQGDESHPAGDHDYGLR